MKTTRTEPSLRSWRSSKPTRCSRRARSLLMTTTWMFRKSPEPTRWLPCTRSIQAAISAMNSLSPSQLFTGDALVPLVRRRRASRSGTSFLSSSQEGSRYPTSNIGSGTQRKITSTPLSASTLRLKSCLASLMRSGPPLLCSYPGQLRPSKS